MLMTGENAHLCVRAAGQQYLIRVFDGAVGLLQQPDGPDRLFSIEADSERPLLDYTNGEIWDLQALTDLIDRFQAELHDATELGTWEVEGGKPAPG